MTQNILFLLMIAIGYAYSRRYGKRAEAEIKKYYKSKETALQSDQEEE